MSTFIQRRLRGRWAFAILAATAAAALWAGGSAGAQETTTFRITIENRTNPEMIVTPGAYLLSGQQGAFWGGGTQASLALERIAEVGDSAEAVATLGAVALDAAPAFGDTVVFEVTAGPGTYLSTVQMLVATNDGFVGLNSEPLFENGSPRSATIDLMAYDAGTEENSDLFAGFDGGQPDPAQGAANVDNGTATAEAISPHGQFSGPQARVTIEPVSAPAIPPAEMPDPAPAGNAGLSGATGGSALIVGALVLLSTGLVLGARRVTARS